ncbi:hypothetical protein F4679DRAFT_536452 [Xylaria curta]|nr:hypothetical protein F4679DRAFT_536452 [Xylaria curta]
MLIDLDLAQGCDKTDASGALQQAGTVQFMAIDVLRFGADHKFRHDLESFFYVLIWMCVYQWRINCDKERETQNSELRKWSSGSFKDIAKNKEADMGMNGLNRIMDEFPKALEFVKVLY